MKKFISALSAIILVGTALAGRVFASGVTYETGKERVVGRLEQQWASTITIKEEEKKDWKDEVKFEMILPVGAKWNLKTSVDGQKISENDLSSNGSALTVRYTKADDEKMDLFYISPYVDLDRKMDIGDLKVDIFKDNEKEPQTLVIGKIAEYSVSLKSNDKTYSINTAKIPVRLELSELIEDSIIAGNGTIFVKDATILPNSVKIDRVSGDKTMEIVEVRDDYVDVNFKEGKNISKWAISFDIKPTKEFTGEIIAGFEKQGVDNQQTIVARIENALTISQRQVPTIKLGMQDQEVTPVEMVETFKGSLAKGDYTLRVNPEYKGLIFIDATLEFTRGMDISNIKVDGNKIHFTVKEQSTRPQVITLKDIKVDLDRFAYDGNYTLELVNDKNPDSLVASVVLFNVNPTIENQQEATKSNSSVEIVFTLGSEDYTVKSLDDGSIRNEKLPTKLEAVNGRTVLPVRAVGENLGLKVDWNQEAQTATLSNENTTIILTKDNKTMVKNGEKIEMDVAPFIKNGTTFLPIAEIGEKALGLERDTNIIWDGENKTVTIIK